MAPVSGSDQLTEKKKSRFSLGSKKKNKETDTPEKVEPDTTGSDTPGPDTPGLLSPPGSERRSSESSSVSKSAMTPETPKKRGGLQMSFKKKRKDNAEMRSTPDIGANKEKLDLLQRELQSKSTELSDLISKLASSDSRISELESAEKDHLEKLDDRKSEIDSLKREVCRLKNVEEEHERLKAENARQAEEVARKSEVTNLAAVVAARDAEIATLRDQLEEMEKAGSVSKQCLKTLQGSISELEERLAAKDTENDSLSRSLSQDFESEMEKERLLHSQELDRKVSEIEALLRDKETALAALSEELAEVKTDRAVLSEEVSRVKSEAEVALSSADRELEKLQQQIEDLTSGQSKDMAALEAKLVKLAEDLTTKESELADIIAQLSLTKTNNAKLESEVVELREQSHEAAEKAARTQEECQRLSADKEAIELESSNVKQQLQKSESDHANVVSDLSGKLEENAHLNKKLSLEIETLTLSNQADKNDLDSLKSELALEKESKTFELQQLSEKSVKTQLEYSNKSDDYEKLITELRTDLYNMKNNRNTAQSQLEDAIKLEEVLKQNLDQEVSSLRLELQQALNSLSEKSSALGESVESLTETKRDAEALAESYDTLKRSHDDLQEQLDQLNNRPADQELDVQNMLEQEILTMKEADQEPVVAIEVEEMGKLHAQVPDLNNKVAKHEIDWDEISRIRAQIPDLEAKVSKYEAEINATRGLRDKLDTVTAELSKTQSEAAGLRSQFPELDEKSDRVSTKHEKEVHDLKSQLSKMTKEAESNRKDSKRSKDQLLDVRATLSETQTKMARITGEKKSLEAQLNTPPATPSPPPSLPDNNHIDKIKSLERQISDLLTQQSDSLPSAAPQSQTAMVAGAALGLAGLSSAVSAYLATLYGC